MDVFQPLSKYIRDSEILLRFPALIDSVYDVESTCRAHCLEFQVRDSTRRTLSVHLMPGVGSCPAEHQATSQLFNFDAR
jgi:hypothetical protein